MKTTRKEIKYIINEKGCYICISHVKDKDGYPRIRRNGKDWRMSRWLYTERFGEIPKGMLVCHMCDNPQCININHLELGSNKQNLQDMVNRNRSLIGTRNPSSILTEKQVLEIYKDREHENKDIAKKFGIDEVTVSHIQTGYTWGSILRKHGIKPIGKGCAGKHNGSAKFTDEQIKEIRKKYESGKYTYVELAKEYNCHINTIALINTRRLWKHIGRSTK